MADKRYRALDDAVKVLLEMPDSTHAERAVVLYAGGQRPVVDAHTHIHRGQMFTADHDVASLANNASLDIILTTPADDYPHLNINAGIGGDGLLYVYEDTVFTGGTLLTIVNHKFTSTKTADEVLLHTPTVSDVGENKITHYIPGGTGGISVGGVGGRSEELILKPSTNYLIRLTNVSGQARRASIDMKWYQSPELPDA